MKSQKWAEFMDELGDSKYQELNKELLKQNVKFPEEKMTFQNLEQYFSNEFQVHFNKNSTRSKWHKKDKYLLIWCVVKLAEKRNIKFNELHQKGVFQYLSSVLDLPEQFLLVKWMSLLKQSLKEIKWTPEEDSILIELKKKYPNNDWTKIAEDFICITKNLRYQKQIRERFNNVINPDINKNPFTHQEKLKVLIKAYQMKKNWSGISKLMPGRTDNKIKNIYNSMVKNIAKKIHFDKFDSKSEQLILKYVCQYNTYDPDEIVSQIENDQKNSSPVKVEHINESSNTSNNQHFIPQLRPSLEPLPFFYPYYYQIYYQHPNINYPIFQINDTTKF